MSSTYPGKGFALGIALSGILASGALIGFLWYQNLAPIQQVYLPVYYRAQYLPTSLGFTNRPILKRYSVITVRGQDATLDTMPKTMGGVGVRVTQTTPALFAGWLRRWIFEGESGWELLQTPLILWGVFAFLWMIASAIFTRKRRQAAQRGERVRGPKNMTVRQFNRSQWWSHWWKKSGFALEVEQVKTMALVNLASSYDHLRLRREDESKHFIVVGDSGTGKTTFLRRLMHYAMRCGDAALVLDGKGEFTREFFDPRKKHRIINPKDNRTIFWDFANEATDETDAYALYTSMFPLKENSGNGEWFDRHARDISSYLHVRSDPRPSCADFGYWLAHPDVLLEKLKGTRHYSTLNPKSPNQQSGVLGTMNQIGMVLSMMPPPSEASFRETFSIRQWAEERDGWLFFTNTADTRDALRPLQTSMIDLAIMRVMSARNQRRRVWFFFDELASLGRLSKLVEGQTMMRSTGNPMVLGLQNVSQLRKLYGEEAKTIFSQAYSKMVFAVSDSESAKELEGLIGDVERRYWRETRNDKNECTVSGPDYKREALIFSSEIQGLVDREGYFLQRPNRRGKVGLRVVHISLPIFPPHFHTQGLVERIIPDAPETDPQTPVEQLSEQPAAAREEKPEEKVETVYKAPPLMWIANNNTVHNESSCTVATQKPSKKGKPKDERDDFLESIVSGLTSGGK